jgi:hypothetical protein
MSSGSTSETKSERIFADPAVFSPAVSMTLRFIYPQLGKNEVWKGQTYDAPPKMFSK